MQQGGDILSFTWQSFAFTVLNFLILVGLLWWLLHKPLLRLLDRRKEEVEEMRIGAGQKAREAEEEKEEYERRREELEEEREEILQQAREEIESRREEILEQAREDGKREVEGLKEDWERRRRQELESLQGDVIDLVVDLGRRMLDRITGEDLDERLRKMLYEQLEETGEGDGGPPGGEVDVISARELDEEAREKIRDRIERVVGGETGIDFDVDEGLIAGVRVEFSSLRVDASLEGMMEVLGERISEAAPVVQGEEGQE
ncbi:MAG: F0F1 ATP synthase subunit delta [bacterium]